MYLNFLRKVIIFVVFCFSAVFGETWDMPTPFPPGNFTSKNAVYFADQVEKLSDGELKIKVHSGASLYKMPEIKRAVRSAQVPIGDILMSAYANENSILGLDAVPFLAVSYDDARKLWKAQQSVVKKQFKKEGLMLLYTVAWPGQNIYAQKSVKRASNLKGVKIRAYNAATARWAELMGGIPTTIQYSEIAQAFSTGLVDAMLTSATTGVDSQAWDFVKHMVVVDAFFPKNLVIINNRRFRKLSKKSQNALIEAGKLAEKRGWYESSLQSDSAIAQLKANGIKVSLPTKALKRDMKKVGKTMLAEWQKKSGSNGKRILDAYRK